MKAEINNNSISPENLKIRAFNFTQHWRDKRITNHTYKLRLELAYFKNYYQDKWDSVISESMIDDDDLSKEIIKCQFPSLDSVIDDSEKYKKLIRLLFEFDGHDILLNIFGDAEKETDTWIINSFEIIEINQNYLQISGECRKNNSFGFYQDY